MTDISQRRRAQQGVHDGMSQHICIAVPEKPLFVRNLNSAEHAVKRHYGVRDSRYKLIHFYNDIDEWELYDLKKDPSEMHNIYGQPGTEKITKRMMKELARLQVVYDDPIREKYPLKY